jgi:hypothetical protein
MRKVLRPFILCLLGLVFSAGQVLAAPSLSGAIKQADAEYLNLPDLPASAAIPEIVAGEESDDGADSLAPREISQGNVTATLAYNEEKSEDGEVARTPVVTVYVKDQAAANGKREVARLEGEDIGMPDPPVNVQIAELDPANAEPEVVVSLYTGGAHCCWDTSVMTGSRDGEAWTTVDAGEFDGGPPVVADLDGDGRYELQTRDNAFLYTFGCYACSAAPLQILAIENGAVKNVSHDERFRPAHAVSLRDMIGEVPDEDVNGFLAGYVGQKILLGEGEQAWKIMLAYYDKASDWGLETCNGKMDDEGNCSGKTVTLSFPEALERMLNENGYKVEK